MNERVQPDNEKARDILSTWLTDQNRSLRNLAQEAGIQPSVLSRFLNGATSLEASSALKLYTVLQHSMNPLNRRQFIEAMGLLPLAAAFSRDGLFAPDRHSLPYGISSRLLVIGLDLHEQAAYEQAIKVLRTAEEMLEGGSSQAAFIGCTIAQMFINLGDYQKAQQEADRVQQTYEGLMDPETRAELYRVRNWVAYYQGHYTHAEAALYKRIHIGEDTGIVRLTNPHFLGRIAYDLGNLCRSPHEADEYFAQAQHYFEQSYTINQTCADAHDQAFDLFRISQALNKQRKFYDAITYRTRAREIFNHGSIGGSIATLQIELEEAKIALNTDEFSSAIRKAELALDGWAKIKYPKGIGDAMHVLGDLAFTQRNLERAFELYVMRLCVYPYERYPTTGHVWQTVTDLREDMIRQQGRTGYQDFLQRIEMLANQRQGAFSYLNHLAVDRSLDVAHVLNIVQLPSSPSPL